VTLYPDVYASPQVPYKALAQTFIKTNRAKTICKSQKGSIWHIPADLRGLVPTSKT